MQDERSEVGSNRLVQQAGGCDEGTTEPPAVQPVPVGNVLECGDLECGIKHGAIIQFANEQDCGRAMREGRCTLTLFADQVDTVSEVGTEDSIAG